VRLVELQVKLLFNVGAGIFEVIFVCKVMIFFAKIVGLLERR
jgi:hypothetical protein